jgi:uncharacterized protein (TIGR01440 family)
LDLQRIALEAKQAVTGLMQEASLRPGQILVVGGSTSEVLGQRIGSASNLEVAEVILKELVQAVNQTQVFLAVQCCEHLNRALVIARAAQEKYFLEEVLVMPVLKAGGALATCAVDLLEDAVVVEKLVAHAGMDIGDTLIGMHLRPVVVPVRLPLTTIGLAHLTLAKTRPKLIGGHRAVYR